MLPRASFTFFAAASVALSLVAGCSAADGSSPDVSESAEADLSARAHGFSVDITRRPTFEKRDGALALVVRGTTNRTVTDVFSWVPDDVFGEARRLSPRTFEVVFRGSSEINSVLSGLPVRVRFTQASGSPRQLTAEMRLAPVYGAFSGDASVFVKERIEPVYAGKAENPLRYRSTFDSRDVASDGAVYSASGGGIAPTTSNGRSWRFDRTFDSLLGELDESTDRTIFDLIVAGESLQKRASVFVTVDALKLTGDDPDEAFPPPSCNASVQACMDAQLAKGDVSTCGTYREVTACFAAPSRCLLGWRVDQLLSNGGFGGMGYQRIEPGTSYPSSAKKQVIAAARQRDPSITTYAAALALGGGFVERHQIERLATGARYDVVVVTVEGEKFGAVFRSGGTAIVASIKGSFLTSCSLLRAAGGGQIGEDCNAQRGCGQGLSCLGLNPKVGVGKCAPTSTLAGTGDSCGKVGTGASARTVSCRSDELVCAGLASGGASGVCAPVYLRQRFDDWRSGTLLSGGAFRRSLEAYGLATVGMETWLSAEIANVVPSSLVVRLVNPAGTVKTIFDGPKLALTEPALDSDNLVELEETVGFPGDESANGTYELVIETRPGSPSGDLANWHLTVTSRFD